MNTPARWRVGEHVAIIGDTGSGKTYLMSKIVDLREFVVVFRTKPDDVEFHNMMKHREASSLENISARRILLTPKYERQLREGFSMLEAVWRHGGWTVVIDEEWYVERLGLREQVERLLTQGRSMGISVMLGTQRPTQISRFCIAEATHVFVFRLEGRDAKTVAEATSPRMRDAIESLRGHDFAYFHRAQRSITIGNARNLAAVFTAGTRKGGTELATSPA